MKKHTILLIMLIMLLLITGCFQKENTNKSSNDISNQSSTDDDDDIEIPSGVGHKHCVRSGVGDDIETDLHYDIYYTDDTLNKLISTEKVMSEKSDVLDEYQKAYENINKSYKNLDYYETTIERNDNYVVRYATIDYDNIDIKKILEIEGEEDNIIKNGKAKVSLWLKLGKKVGITCEEVEE